MKRFAWLFLIALLAGPALWAQTDQSGTGGSGAAGSGTAAPAAGSAGGASGAPAAPSAGAQAGGRLDGRLERG